jgi:hypothetical protein
MRDPESKISVQAVGANVILRGTFKTSILNIQNAKFSENDVFFWSVVSVGSDVREDIQVGDNVVLHSAPNIKCYVPENRQNVYSLRKAVLGISNKDLKDLRKMTTGLVVVEYFVVPESYIVAKGAHTSDINIDMDLIMKFLDACEVTEVDLDTIRKAPKLDLV